MNDLYLPNKIKTNAKTSQVKKTKRMNKHNLKLTITVNGMKTSMWDCSMLAFCEARNFM